MADDSAFSSSQCSHSGSSPSGSCVSSRASSPNLELLDKYNTLVSSLLDTAALPILELKHDGSVDSEGEEERKGMTKAEKQNAKKKRRKERERVARLAAAGASAGDSSGVRGTVVPFRLFSSTSVRPIDFGEKVEVYDIPANPRHRPLSDIKVEQTRIVARQAAVDFPDLGGPCCVHARWSRSFLQTRVLQASASLHPIFVAVVDDFGVCEADAPFLQHPSTRSIMMKTPARSGKTATDSTHYAQPVQVYPQSPTRYRRPRRRPRERSYPAYWRPAAELGGKSVGYALGHPSSAYPL